MKDISLLFTVLGFDTNSPLMHANRSNLKVWKILIE
jgi:hypothetical protein